MNQDSNKIKWQELMKIGIGTLRLNPETFWKMTPQEFQAILESYSLDKGSFGLEDLKILQQQFPD